MGQIQEVGRGYDSRVHLLEEVPLCANERGVIHETAVIAADGGHLGTGARVGGARGRTPPLGF